VVVDVLDVLVGVDVVDDAELAVVDDPDEPPQAATAVAAAVITIAEKR
jgi:hypothetical protein